MSWPLALNCRDTPLLGLAAGDDVGEEDDDDDDGEFDW